MKRRLALSLSTFVVITLALLLVAGVAHVFFGRTAPQPPSARNPIALHLKVSQTGEVTISGKRYVTLGDPKDAKERILILEDLFEIRKLSHWRRGSARPQDYPLLVEAHPDAPFEYVQVIWMLAHHHGNVWDMTLKPQGSELWADVKYPRESRYRLSFCPRLYIRICACRKAQDHDRSRQAGFREGANPNRLTISVGSKRLGTTTWTSVGPPSGELLSALARVARE